MQDLLSAVRDSQMMHASFSRPEESAHSTYTPQADQHFRPMLLDATGVSGLRTGPNCTHNNFQESGRQQIRPGCSRNPVGGRHISHGDRQIQQTSRMPHQLVLTPGASEIDNLFLLRHDFRTEI